jgi:hypothetical protein
MILLKLNGIDIEFPSIPEDILLKQYIPFKRMYDEMNALKESLDVEDGEDIPNVFLKEAECVVQSLYLFIDEDKIDLYELPIRDKQNKGLSQLYDMIVTIISSYKPLSNHKQDYSFKFKGIDYTIKGIHKEGKKDLTLIESIEILESQRVAATMDKSRSDDARYSSMLTTLAVLSRKENEKFPKTQLDINQMISERTNEFVDIPYTIALDAAFFLTFILE